MVHITGALVFLLKPVAMDHFIFRRCSRITAIILVTLRTGLRGFIHANHLVNVIILEGFSATDTTTGFSQYPYKTIGNCP